MSTDTRFRQAVLSVLLTSLIVTSGCAGLLPGGPNEAETGTPIPEKRTNGTDLRSMSLPENGSITVSGELDHGDPNQGNKFYEPVQVVNIERQIMKITMETEGGNPTLRVVSPDGNVTRSVSSKNGNATIVLDGESLQSERYMLEATSGDRNATFNYTLTINRLDQNWSDRGNKLLAGDVSQWNKTEQYLSFGKDFVEVSNGTSYYGKFDEEPSNDSMQANTTGDYLVFTYELSSDYNSSQKNAIDVSFMLTYTNMRKRYTQFGKQANITADVTWVPDIIFLRGVDNETGELLRTTFLTEEWARAYGKHSDNSRYAGWYYSTLRHGPGSPDYDPEEGITNDEFPQAYHDYTYPGDNSTLAERYSL